jgi:uncharacterized membrane protein
MGIFVNLNPIFFLQDNVENLWYSVYSLIAGWGLTMTIIVAIIVVLAVRLYRCERRVIQLENRLIHAERDYNLTLEQWKKK